MHTHQSYLQSSLQRTLSPKLARSLALRLRRAKFCWEGKNFSLKTFLDILKYTAYLYFTHYGTIDWPVLPLPRPGTKWTSKSPSPSDQGFLGQKIRLRVEVPNFNRLNFPTLFRFEFFVC